MSAKRTKREDQIVRRIREKLVSDYVSQHRRARVDVKRYNSACVRLRVIDPDFKAQGELERDDTIWNILRTLPEEISTEVSLMVLLTPKEAKTSFLNVEFEEFTPPPCNCS